MLPRGPSHGAGKRGGRYGRRVPATSATLPTRVVALLAACHPGPTVVVTTLCTALAVAVGAPAGTVVLVLAVVLAGQLSIGWSNDWVDAARDRAVGRSDKPVVTGAVSPGVLRASAFAALAVAVVLSLVAGPAAAAAHGAVVAMGWAYNLGLKSTVASGVPYAVAFGALPAFVVLALPGAALPAGWLVAVGALLGVGAHLVNVLPDLEDDAGTGVRGLPHRLGRRATSVLAPTVLAAAVVVAVLGPPGAPGAVPAVVGVAAVAVAVAAGVVGVTRPTSRLPFTLAMLVAGLCVLVLVVTGAAGAVT